MFLLQYVKTTKAFWFPSSVYRISVSLVSIFGFALISPSSLVIPSDQGFLPLTKASNCCEDNPKLTTILASFQLLEIERLEFLKRESKCSVTFFLNSNPVGQTVVLEQAEIITAE